MLISRNCTTGADDQTLQIVGQLVYRLFRNHLADDRRSALILALWIYEDIQKKTKDEVPKLNPEHRRGRT